MTRTHLSDRVYHGVLLALMLVCSVLLVEKTIWSMQTIPLMHNEGWNAVHTSRAMSGGHLYQYDTAFLVNNYPPLSFYVVGLLSTFGPDYIFAGRLLNFISVGCITGCIVGILKNLHLSNSKALLGGILFIALMTSSYDSYLGKNDPNLFGNALSVFGFALFLKRPTNKGSLFVVALFCLLSGLVKPHLLGMPIAVTMTLLLRHRTSFVVWCALCLSLVVMTIGGLYLVFGPSLFTEMNSDRIFSFTLLVHSVGYVLWLPAGLAVVFLLTAFTPNHTGKHVAIKGYVIASFLCSVPLLGGAGTNYNLLFEWSIALCIAVPLQLHDILPAVSTKRMQGYSSVAVGTLLCVMPPTLLNPIQYFADLNRRIDAERNRTIDDLDYLETFSDPVLCETMALCYWSEHPIVYDSFNVAQSMTKDPNIADSVLQDLRQHKYAVIQVTKHPEQGWSHTSDFIDTLQGHYTLSRTSNLNQFYVPKVTSVVPSRESQAQ